MTYADAVLAPVFREELIELADAFKVVFDAGNGEIPTVSLERDGKSRTVCLHENKRMTVAEAREALRKAVIEMKVSIHGALTDEPPPW